MPQKRPDPTRPDKTDYVLVYDGENGVRLAPPGAGRRQTLEVRMGWAPREAWETEDLGIETAEETLDAPPRRRGALLAGAAGLCVLGVALGLTIRSPRLEPPAGPPSQAIAAQAPAPAPDSAPADAPPLRLAEATVVEPEPLARAPQAAPRRTAVVARPAPRRVDLATNAHAAPRRAAPALRDRTDCGDSHADAMVCGDAELAAADRRLAQALQTAVTSGASLEDLRAQQDAWRIQRDAAARISRAAVGRAYERRIEELKTNAPGEPPY